MDKIISVKGTVSLSKKLKAQGKTIVLAGGCFDILHIGHILFLGEAKKQADVLFVLLESDETIQKIKGRGRPINSQQDRATLLLALALVDYVVVLPSLKSDKDYDQLIFKIKPTIIATTKNDPNKIHKIRQAKLSGAKIVEVIDRISNQSTSKLAKLLSEEQFL